MSVIKSKEIFSPQNYCDTFLGLCPILSGEQNSLRKYMDDQGFSNLWDYPFEEIEYVVENRIPVVLVDTTYIDDTCEMVHEYRWFEVPDDNEENQITVDDVSNCIFEEDGM